ncbi:MAG: hypothetical protein IJ409_00085 [Lachnospiraceae bacterium]|nr:hypothetical protein [Lachnospiraceae bacterium]
MSEFDTNLDAGTVETQEETDKKCPDCFGVMDFDPKTGGLACPYCGHTEAIPVSEEAPVAAEEQDLASADKLENCNWGVEKKTVICKSCGGESIYDALEIASVCPFCGSNQVMEASDQNTMAPGGVVPFAVTDKQASDLFRSWIAKKWFCPKMAKESAKAKNFKGIYLPYWTFDAKTYSEYVGEYGIDKKRDDRIVTNWYAVRGNSRLLFDDELVCGTTKHSQSMLQGIEPYRTAENKTYKPEYVAGFAAERYSIGIKEAWEMAKQSMKYKIRNTIETGIKRQHHADRVRNLRITTKYSDLTYKYLLLPVWISSYKYQDKVYQFMVNGQTGKVSGKIPISIPKVILTVAGAILLFALFMWLFGG